MLTLSLYRHAKSAWNDPLLRDFDRPLSARGRVAATQMGAYMAASSLMPDFVRTSPSIRTKSTCALTFQELPAEPALAYEQSLYLASPATILALVRGTPASVRRMMIVGHNPGLHVLANELIGNGAAGVMLQLREKMPTAALVVIHFDTRQWEEIGPRTGRLEAFVTPRSLMA